MGDTFDAVAAIGLCAAGLVGGVFSRKIVLHR
jgi:hypothetical protein